MRRIIQLSLVVVLAANLCLAEEGASLKEGQKEEDIQGLSTDELERRLEDVDMEIGELETKAEYFKTEPPDYTSSPATIERTGFESQDVPKSKLLSPQVKQETAKRLDELYELKENIESEIDKR